MLRVNDRLTIPDGELRFKASRSGGPGGQHVNTTNTRVQLEFDVAGSPSLNDGQRALILERLASRIDADGVLRLAGQSERSQLANKRDVLERLAELLRRALAPRKSRRATKPTMASRRRRVEAKKQRAGVKRLRGKVDSE